MQQPTSRRQFEAYRERKRNESPADSARGRHGDRPKPSGPRQRGFGELLKRFWGLLDSNRRAVLWALGMLTFATLLKLAPPAAIKVAVDLILSEEPLPKTVMGYSIPQQRATLLFMIGGLVVAGSALATVIHLMSRWWATRAVNLVQVSLRKKLFEHTLRLPLQRIYELKTGGATSLLREDTGGSADLIFSMLYNPWRAIVQLVGSLLILIIVDWRMMLGGLMLLPVVYLTHRTWIHRIRPLWRDVRAQRQQIDATATEAFGGMRIVRAFARERMESGRFVRGNNLLVRQQLFVWLWTRVIEVIWELLIPAASTMLLMYGGYRILQNEMTLGDLTMFLFYLAMLLGPLATLVASAATFQNNLAGLDRILDVLAEEREMADSNSAVQLSRQDVVGGITLNGVSFRYPGSDRVVLEDINLDVKPGETIAFVGRSGAGKTTLCNLIARFYDPTTGNIQLDGRDLRDIRIDSFRQLLGIVEQDVFLFDGAIDDNIRYGRRGASESQVAEAAVAANAEEFISKLEQGYASVIGERGVKLSGGQRQRLAIARALVADPTILILDEATSNLDSESESLIQSSLARLMEGRTCFVIAHRMSTIGLADRIAVLDEGRFVAIGRHHELLQSSPEYRRMVELQTLPALPTETQ
jgi:ATP-binding cassette subfamily B protein/subfamily B ATP-binding cassette protein MsbA